MQNYDCMLIFKGVLMKKMQLMSHAAISITGRNEMHDFPESDTSDFERIIRLAQTHLDLVFLMSRSATID